jgi:hypothetical protein
MKLNGTDIDTLSGRELDAAVAEHVMRWPYVRCGPRCWGIPPGGKAGATKL